MYWISVSRSLNSRCRFTKAFANLPPLSLMRSRSGLSKEERTRLSSSMIVFKRDAKFPSSIFRFEPAFNSGVFGSWGS